jgi:hypothetical protein
MASALQEAMLRESDEPQRESRRGGCIRHPWAVCRGPAIFSRFRQSEVQAEGVAKMRDEKRVTAFLRFERRNALIQGGTDQPANPIHSWLNVLRLYNRINSHALPRSRRY